MDTHADANTDATPHIHMDADAVAAYIHAHA
jgi:hypothetical protein